jgi:hypothetical protein
VWIISSAGKYSLVDGIYDVSRHAGWSKKNHSTPAAFMAPILLTPVLGTFSFRELTTDLPFFWLCITLG